MKTKVLQTFRVLFLFLLAFVIFHSLNQSQDSEIIIINHKENTEEVINNMLKKGFLRKDFSYYFLKLILTIRGEVDPGGYVVKKGMGAVTTAFTLTNPEYRFVTVLPGERKGQIADKLGKTLKWSKKNIREFDFFI